MGVWANINTFILKELDWPHLIEKNERPYHLPFRGRQRTTHLETTQVSCARNNQCLYITQTTDRWALWF